MGIVNKIYFGISNTITTDQGKLITGFAYGIGASVVIIGALFKILHLKGAEEMLMLGMGAEAFLFALGSFEPPHKEYDWSLVYPILAMGHGHKPSGEELPPAQNAPSMGRASAPAGVAAVNVEIPSFGKEEAEKLSQGIKKLSDTASTLGDLSDASIATEKYISTMGKASASVDHLSKAHDNGAVEIEKASASFGEAYGKVVNSFESSLNTVNEKSTAALSKATDDLISSYKSSSESLSANIDSVNGSSKEMQASLKGISSQLGQINSVYEMQLNSLNEQLAENKIQAANAKSINGNLSAADASVKEAAEYMAAFKGETAKLKQQVTDLNAVYGNMLNALNVEA